MTGRIPARSKREPAATFHGQRVDLCVRCNNAGTLAWSFNCKTQQTHHLRHSQCCLLGFPASSPPRICKPPLSMLGSSHPLCLPSTSTRSTPLIPPRGARRKDSYWGRTEGAPDLWKWTICHLPSLRCQTRVSSDWAVRGMPPASRYCVMRM